MPGIFTTLRLLFAFGVALATVVGTAWLSDYYLSGIGGLFLYLPDAGLLNLAGISLTIWLLPTNTSRSTVSAIRPLAGFDVIARHVVRVVALAVVSVIFLPFATGAVIHQIFHSDPIGVGTDVARGPCETRAVAFRRSASGFVADVRKTFCSGNWDGDLMYFVFVRGNKEGDTKPTLVFRYFADPLPSTKPPTALWVSRNRLVIAARSDVMDVTYRLSDIKGISIEYHLRK